jgi:uncharacterized protein
MIIGIDIDNTITHTREMILEYMRIFQRENDLRDEIDLNHYDLEDTVRWNQELIERFLSTYLEDIYKYVIPKEYAVEVINRLHRCHTIILITSRNHRDQAVKQVTLDWLARHDLEFDRLIMNGTQNMHHFSKLTACQENGIQVMVEDHHDLSRELSEHIPVIMFDYPYNHDLQADNIYRVHNWLEVEALIENLAGTQAPQAKDPPDLGRS